MHPSLVVHNPVVIRFSQQPQRLCLHFLFFLGSRSFCLFIWLFIHFVMRKQTLVSSITTRFIFHKIGTRADANIHKTFACRYLSNSICTVVEEWTNDYFCLGYFSSWTHIYLLIRLAEGVAAACSGFCARSWVSWRKLQRSPCEHWPCSFHWEQVPFLSSTPLNSLSTLYHGSRSNSLMAGVKVS